MYHTERNLPGVRLKSRVAKLGLNLGFQLLQITFLTAREPLKSHLFSHRLKEHRQTVLSKRHAEKSAPVAISSVLKDFKQMLVSSQNHKYLHTNKGPVQSSELWSILELRDVESAFSTR